MIFHKLIDLYNSLNNVFHLVYAAKQLKIKLIDH